MSKVRKSRGSVRVYEKTVKSKKSDAGKITDASKWNIVQNWLNKRMLKQEYFDTIVEENAKIRPDRKDVANMSRTSGDRLKSNQKTKLVQKRPEDISFERVASILKARRAAQSTSIPTKKQPKMSKKDLKMLKIQEMEKFKADVAAFRLVLLEEERQRLLDEREKHDMNETKLIEDHATRIAQLRESGELIDKIFCEARRGDCETRAAFEWEQYRSQDAGHTDISDCHQMNQYIATWKQRMKECDVGAIVARTEQVMELIRHLEYLVRYPLYETDTVVNERIEITAKLKRQLRENIDEMTLYLLGDVRNRFIGLNDVRKAYYQITTGHMTLCIWSKMLMPKPLEDPKHSTGTLTKIVFPEANVAIQLPTRINYPSFAIRLLWTQYDHYSCQCSMYADVDLLKEIDCSFERYVSDIFQKTQMYKYERRVIVETAEVGSNSSQENVSKQEDVPVEETLAKQITYDRSIRPLPSSQILIDEDAACAKFMNSKIPILEKGQLNLRRYRIVGGVISIGLYEQPPQPNRLYRSATMRTLRPPIQLVEIPIKIPYVDSLSKFEEIYAKISRQADRAEATRNEEQTVNPLDEETLWSRNRSINVRKSVVDKYGIGKPVEARTPFEMEARETLLSDDLNRLVLVRLSLPRNVFWSHQPTICYWNDTKSTWIRATTHDVQFDADELTLSFRTGVLKSFGLAINRYDHLPFYNWSMVCKSESCVALRLQTKLLRLEIHIERTTFTLKSIAIKGTTNILAEMTNVPLSFLDLKNALRNAGVDIFPANDAGIYVENLFEKHAALEKHTYLCMAILSTTHDFRASKWNELVIENNPRTIVFRIRTRDERSYSTVHATMSWTRYVDVDENTEQLIVADDGLENERTKQHSDLYILVRETGTFRTRAAISAVDPNLVRNVFDVLSETRVLSFTRTTHCSPSSRAASERSIIMDGNKKRRKEHQSSTHSRKSKMSRQSMISDA